MLVIRKKNMIVGLLVVLLIVTGYLNFWYNQNSTPTVKPEDVSPPTDDPDQNQLETNQLGLEEDKAIGGKITVTDLEDPSNSEIEEGTVEGTVETTASAHTAFFRDYRFEREQGRSEEVEYINSVVNNPASDPEIIKEAQSQLLEITSNMEAELVMENLIKAKGFRDAIVIIHRENVNVIIDKSELVPEEVAMISDIVKRESGKDIDNIKIIPKI